jgi:putative peptidoglycan lipid II flippase
VHVSQQTDGIVRGAGILAALTLLSRVLGLVRDVLCAALFGAGVTWDAFSFAFRVPNTLRRLLGEGALSAAFVPIFTARLESEDPGSAARMAGRVTSALAGVLVLLVVAGEALVLALLAWAHPNEQWRLALGLTAVLLPYMLPICLTALLGAILNSLRRFATPALAPVTLNVVWIAAAAFVAPLVSADPKARIYVVAAAIMLSGMLQLGLQAGDLRAKRFRIPVSPGFWSPDVRGVAAAMAPVALGMAALQANVLLDGVMALSLAAPAGKEAFSLWGLRLPYPMQIGANSVLYYGNRLMQLPLGVFGIAIATAAFPALSRHAARGDREGFSAAALRSLGLVAFVAVPSGVGLILLRRPVIELLFERGEFTAGMSARTAAVTLAYSTAIWAYCGLHVLSRAFYALGRPGTPAAVAAGAVLANVALNLALVWPLAEAGLAAATALTAALQVALLWWLLCRAGMVSKPGRLAATVGKTLIAAACMAAVCAGTMVVLPEGRGLATKLLRAAAPAGTGALAYVVAAAVLRIDELRAVARRIFRRSLPG